MSIPDRESSILGPRARSYFAVSIAALDRYLRERQEIFEFSDAPDCVFRRQIISHSDDVTLADGLRLRCGDRLIDLHFWNEHIPAFPKSGVTWGWAREADLRVDFSLRELARFLASHRELDDVKAIRARLALGTARHGDQIARIAARYGFEKTRSQAPRLRERLHWLGENILISLLVLAENASALRPDTLWRDRMLTFLSRDNLERRYGSPD